MELFVGVAGGAAAFFSFFAYCETRDALQMALPRKSSRVAKLGGLCVGALVLALSILALQIVSVSGA